MKSDSDTAVVLLGNQLFAPSWLAEHQGAPVFMAEDVGLCTYVRHHKQKIALFLAAMRHQRDELIAAGHRVHYETLDASGDRDDGYEAKLDAFVRRERIKRLRLFDVADSFFEERLRRFAADRHLALEFMPSPMFLTDRATLQKYFSAHKPRMADFYKWQRRRLNVLVTARGDPIGGRWSFDADNRKALPRNQAVPDPPRVPPSNHVLSLIPTVNERFADHPGVLSRDAWWLPVTRPQARAWFTRFLDERLPLFGDYEDALSAVHPVLFHAVLTPSLNLGLVTPDEVLSETLAAASSHHVPLNALEGFVRQIIGWREFIHGVYRRWGAWQEKQNVFRHTRGLTHAWYHGRTDIPLLDEVIHKAWDRGWVHHIERLMVVANLMNLCEIHPREAYAWFMEMFVDSSDWVMVPNVYGMGLFADGGLFATKPYIAASHYLTKMAGLSSRRAPGDWHDVVDGLFWRFVDKHRDLLGRNQRLAQLLSSLERMNPDRRAAITAAAEDFLRRHTRPRSVEADERE